MDSKKIGRLIARRRKELGLTQQALADQLSVTNKAVSKWERGQGVADVSLLKDLAKILEITVDELLEGETEDSLDIENHCYEEIVVNKKDYFQYIKQEQFQKRKLRYMLFVIAVLCIFSGIALKEANRFLDKHLDVIGMIMILLGISIICYYCFFKYIKKAMFHEKKISYVFNDETLVYQDAGYETTFYYNQFSFMYELENRLVLKVNHEILWIDKKYRDLFIEKASHLIDYTYKDSERYQWIALTGLSSLFIICSCLLLGYHFVLKRIGFEMIFDSFYVVLWQVEALCMIYCVVILRCHLDKKRIFIMTMMAVLCLGGGWLISAHLSPQKVIYSLSPDLSHQLVLKKNRFHGKMTYYHDTFLCFAKPTDQMDSDMNLDISTHWVTDDCNMIAYTNNNQKQIYVATYGDRGNGISYYNVIGSMQGNWIKKSDSDLNYSMSVDDRGITIKYKDREETYSYNDTKQNGTIAVTIYDRYRNPRYVLVMNENCTLNQDYILKNDGTVQLIVLDKNLTSVEMFCTTYKEDEEAQKQIDDQMQTNAKTLVKKMQKILKDDPTLQKYQSTYDLFKIETEFNNMFEVVRLAYQADIGENINIKNYIGTDQITNISIPAGTINDFYVEVKADTSLKNKSTGEISYNGYIPHYRIMKGEGCYLIARITYRMPGAIGLSPLIEKIEKDVSNNQDYYFERES